MSQKLSSKVNIFKSAIEGIKGIYKMLHNPISMAELEGFKSYQDLLRETKQVLNDVTTTREYRGKQTKLIILVDEIDRCLPDEQLKILERLHHLFDVKNCAVICAINKKGIIKNFGNQSMTIPLQVWNILVKYADEIFKDYNNEKEN